ncbi:hypothetical protein H0266_14725 [Halobacillus locisalis]|uniref:Uncharacterized protein n=1 Tax=Halobacillus locisalis TaxID=220753 RepID=A0A838CW34_9BACI|nr:hypothetical protein [Halobacillus locisalis]MBA2176148.1 hypothetical protein [Halobacillus locisalis]
MKRVEQSLLDAGTMTPDYEEGDVQPGSKMGKRLRDAFVANRSQGGNEGFYQHVARSLVEENGGVYAKISLFFVVAFAFLWGGIRLYVAYFESISGILAILVFLGLFAAPILGFFSGMVVPGWKKYVLMLVNVALLIFMNYSLV